MLKHLIPKTYPIADKNNTVIFGEYRITVLDSGLFRIEHDPRLIFNDSATQSVWFRNMPHQKYNIEYGEGTVCVSTDIATLTVAEELSLSRVSVGGESLPLENAENLLGTYRTLDCYDGEVYIRDGSRLKLENGVCSKNGVAVFDDTHSLRLSEDGGLMPSSDDLLDIYRIVGPAHCSYHRDSLQKLHI